MKIIRFKNLKFVPASHEDPKNPGVFKKRRCCHYFRRQSPYHDQSWQKNVEYLAVGQTREIGGKTVLANF